MEISIPEFTRDNDRGQVGIETLIVFIAMILVAAIAASVLINTAGFLQNQASETSQDSEDQVSNQVLIISSVGDVTEVEEGNIDLTLTFVDDGAGEYELEAESDIVPDGTVLDISDAGDFDGPPTEIEVGETLTIEEDAEGDNSLEVEGEELSVNSSDADEGDEGTAEIQDFDLDSPVNQIGGVSMTVMQSPGANEIDLAGASLEYIGPDGQEILSYSEAGADADEGLFGVVGTQDPDDTEPVLTQREDRYTVTVDLEQGEDALRLLDEGEDATVRINTQAGSEAVTILNVPQSISSFDDGDAVEL